MVVSIHSHSGEFCHHATGDLESVVEAAIQKGFIIYGLSEHMPRYRTCDLYPEESNITPTDTYATFLEFLKKAAYLKEKYSDRLEVLVGMETEWIYSESLTQIKYLLQNYPIQYIIGSVHHVEEIPIDYNESLVSKAEDYLCQKLNSDQGTELLFTYYFNSQYEMLIALKPDVIGHFDLVRLFRPNFPLSENVWKLIKRNISVISSYGGIVELNSRSLKKGLPYVYPFKDILLVMISENIRFTLSDDSHGPSEVGLHYDGLYKTLLKYNIRSIWIPSQLKELQVIDHEFWKNN